MFVLLFPSHMNKKNPFDKLSAAYSLGSDGIWSPPAFHYASSKKHTVEA